MNPLAYLSYWLAQRRRNQGAYNKKTLNLFAKASGLSNKARFHLAYARFQRDLNGTVDIKTIDLLKANLPTVNSALNKRSKRLLSEFSQVMHNDNREVVIDTELSTLEQITYSQNNWRSELLNFLTGKSVAVVGNGTSLKNSRFGKEIDEMGVVCRFNRFPTKNDLKLDTSSKTDIWITSPDVFNEGYPIPNTVKWIVISGGDALYTLQDWSAAEEHLNNHRKIVTIPLNIWSSLVQEMKAPPSAGTLWLHYLTNQKALRADIHIYGFDKAISKTKRYHITSNSFKPSSRHAWSKEKEYLKKLISNKQISAHYGSTFGTLSKGLVSNNNLLRHLKSNELVFNPSANESKEINYMIGWGRKPNTEQARAYAKKHNLPYLALEDGFIHSMSQGRLGAASWSLVVDKTGIFYDATQTSDLETLINTSTLTNEQIIRARSCINQITKNYITKYNNAPLVAHSQLKQYKSPVLVLDQVAGDMSIPYAMAAPETFQTMLDTAISENPNSDILIKIHPDVINGKRKGCISLPKQLPDNLHTLTDNLNPLVLMEHVDKVYVVSSQAGFEALLLNKKVICFGAPFYAGWGLTSDRFDNSLKVVKRRTRRASLEEVFYATYISYSRYLDPINQRPCKIESILDHVARQHRYYLKNSGLFICIGLTPWKKRFIKSLLKGPDNKLHFIKTQKDAKKHNCDEKTKLLIWSNKHLSTAEEISKSTSAQIIKIEDGFLRSVNLGSNYTLPSSLVFDSKGIYFDPTKESELESILNNNDFSKELIHRASELRNKLVSLGISKYNLGMQDNEHLPAEASGKKVILVPGQVADDASIKLGCIDINTNLDLLKAAKESNPNAYIIYKPHPDVVSDNRAGAIPTEQALKYCDQVIEDQSISICLSYADEVHTLTSLVGFEALLRGLTVHCYGIPFYSNWGLTQDRHTLERRKRKLNINELTAGTLIIYPRYFDWATNSFISAETVVEQLYEQSKSFADKKQQSIYSQKLSGYMNLFRALFTTYTK